MKESSFGSVRVRTRLLVYVFLPLLLLAGLSLSLWVILSDKQNTDDILSPDERTWLKEHPTILLAPDPNFPPIESFDEHGNYTGLVADIFKKIEENIDYQFKYVRLNSWNDVLDAAKEREVDGITAAQMTPERSEYLLFTQPILDIPNVIIVREDMPGEFSFAKMSGMQVSVTEGNALHEYIQAQFPDIDLIPVNDDLEALKEVSFGRADATVVNLAIASYLIEEHGITNLRVAGDSGKNNSLYIATRSDQPVLNQIMQKGLASIPESERQSIYGRWISLDTQSFWKSRQFWLLVATGLTIISLVIVFSFAWTAALRREVKNRTRQLDLELLERKRAQEALIESETRFRALFDTAYDAILLMDGDVFVECNSRAVEMFGCANKNDLIGQTPWEYSPQQQPDGKISVKKATGYIRKANQGAPQLFYWKHCRKDGTLFDAEVSLNTLTIDKKMYSQAIVRDISEQLRVERDLYQSRERLDLALRGAGLSVFDWEINTGKVHYDEYWADMLGYSQEEIELPENVWEKLIHPDDRDAAQEKSRAILSGETDFYELEQRMLHKSGRYIWVLVRSRVMERDEDGRPLRISGVHMDITARKQAEDALQKGEERFRLAMEASNEGLWDWDFKQKQNTYFSPQYFHMLGYTPGELAVGEGRWIELVHPDDKEHVTQVNDDCIAGRIQNFEMEFRMRTKSGDWRWILSRGRAVAYDSEGNTLRMMGTHVDITKQKQREHESQVIATLSSALRAAENREEMLPIILEQTVELLEADAGELELVDPLSGDAVVELATGEFKTLLGERTPAGEGFNSYILASGKPYLNNRVAEDPKILNPDLFTDLPARAGVAMIAQQQLIGFLWIGRKKDILERDLRPLAAIADIAANAIRRTTLHEQTQKQLMHLAALRKIDTVIGSSQNMQVMVNIVLDQVIKSLQVDAACIYLLNPEDSTLACLAKRGFQPDLSPPDTLSLSGKLAGKIVQTGRTLKIPELTIQDAPAVFEAGFRSFFGVPLTVKGDVKGTLEVFLRRAFTPEEAWLNFLEMLGGQAGIAIDNATLFQDLQRSNIELAHAYEATIEGWSSALDLRDKETEGHSQRVTALTLVIAMKLGFRDADLVHINRGALLHDIGKMGIPDSILLKPGKLTEEEWAVMRRHPQYAYDMLHTIDYLQPALDIPYCHHERWDGTGYPRGLKGEEIPLAARIFAVVDVWDAITSDRPYRPAWPEEKAIEHIRTSRGTHFDPHVVDIFLDIISNFREGYH